MGVKFISINSNGLNHPAKRKSMWREATSNRADILCVQETHFSAISPPVCSHRSFPHVFTANAPNKTRGGLTAVRDTVAFALYESVLDPRGRYIIVVCDINNSTFTIVNVYSPNKHQIRFFS